MLSFGEVKYMKKSIFCGALAGCLLFSASCFADVQPSDLGLTWLTSDNVRGYFVKNIKVAKDRSSIKGDFYLWKPGDGTFEKLDGKLDYKKKKMAIYAMKVYSIEDGSLLAEEQARTIYYIKTGEPLGYMSMGEDEVHPFAAKLAEQYRIPYTRPSVPKTTQQTVRVNETVANCTVYAQMVSRDVCDYTCVFSGGNTYNFRARIGLKGAFSWYVLSGNEPACFRSDRVSENDARIKLYQAALSAGYQPPFAG